MLRKIIIFCQMLFCTNRFVGILSIVVLLFIRYNRWVCYLSQCLFSWHNKGKYEDMWVWNIFSDWLSQASVKDDLLFLMSSMCLPGHCCGCDSCSIHLLLDMELCASQNNHPSGLGDYREVTKWPDCVTKYTSECHSDTNPN